MQITKMKDFAFAFFYIHIAADALGKLFLQHFAFLANKHTSATERYSYNHLLITCHFD